MKDLEDFTACLWQTASLHRGDLDLVQREAARHAGNALVESCQRIEAYTLGCDCAAPQRLYGRDALVHLAAVAAGLHSAVLGEEQVIGQVRSALAVAPPGIRELGDLAIAAARELRRNTSFNTHSGHLLDRALALTGVEPGGSVLVLGTGHMARLVGRRALDLGFGPVLLAGRRKPDGAWFHEGAFEFVALESVASAPAVDIAIGCLGSSAPAVEVTSGLPAVRRLLLDLGTPRNFCGNSPVPLLDIAALLDAGHHHSSERRGKLTAQLRTIIERRIGMAGATRESPVGALREAVERIRRREIDRIHRLHPEIPGETLELITRSLVNQLFHLPSERLKQLDDPALTARVAELFYDDVPAEAGVLARS